MPRIRDIENVWGKTGGPNPQRSDLWQVELTDAISGINEALKWYARPWVNADDLPPYYIAAVTLPELKVRAEPVRRDSRAYNMPSWDEPLDAIKIVFIMDDGGVSRLNNDAKLSAGIIRLLSGWRALVRAGRGSVGLEKSAEMGDGSIKVGGFNDNYQLSYQWPIYVNLCRGGRIRAASSTRTASVPAINQGYQSTFDGGADDVSKVRNQMQVSSAGFQAQISDGMELSTVFRLENAWLSGYRVSDLNYEGSRVLTVEATFYADNLCQVPS